ncbi:hypothetical protein PS685_03305 [Pseudomonas fluorescens]|uniref:Uncharacterized protein n=1 Tax=Pseudomonas fluorescens TaxID=294 RepID=A0A5E6Z3T4_PSEFL|nr:hypothetical protein PS685_03305 [Pseudomonas fluorescens]
MVTQLGHRQPRIATGVNPSKRFQVHVHIQGQTVEGAAIADPQAQRGDFRAIDIHARRIGLGCSAHAIAGEQVDQALFHPRDQLTYAIAQPAHIEHQVGNQLAGAVVGHLATAIRLHHRDISR